MNTSNIPNPYRVNSVALRCLCMALLGVLFTGCAPLIQGTIAAMNQADQNRDGQKLSGLLGEHIRDIQNMKARGDPMGDYLWAYANNYELIPNAEKNPEQIAAMYKLAAEKGSVDAELMLALRHFYNGALLKQNKPRLERLRKNAIEDGKPVPPGIEAALQRFVENPQLDKTPAVVDLAEVGRREAIWRQALDELELATQKQCYYFKPYIFAPANAKCLSPRIAADDVWHEFRDGMAYPKDSGLRDKWYEKALECESSMTYQRAAKACVPGTAGRFKGGN